MSWYHGVKKKRSDSSLYRTLSMHYPISHQRLLRNIKMLFCSGRDFPSLRGAF
jgi:hypothetical protein